MRKSLLLAATAAALLAPTAGQAAAGDRAFGAGTAGPCIVEPASTPPFCPFIERRFSLAAFGFGSGVGAFGFYTHTRVDGMRAAGIVR